MDQSSFLNNLPSEIIIDILSRLPIKTIIHCKCVCKSWLHLLETTEFAKSHISKSVPGLIVYIHNSPKIKLLEFIDELDLENHELHYNLVTEFDKRPFIGSISVVGSVNGLLFLREVNTDPNALYICNPTTREFIDLPRLEHKWQYPSIVTYGFGLSKTSGQYKVVRVFHECVRDCETGSLLSIPKSECNIYTIGEGSWRTITPNFIYEYNCRSCGVFLNGNLHWLVADLKESLLISCLDLETETFSRFSLPLNLPVRRRFLGCLNVLGGCLCLCDNSSETEIVIWIMKEYGVEKSWKKEFVISKVPNLAGECYEVVYPFKVFRDGDILMSWDDFHMFYYSNKPKSTSRIEIFGLGNLESIQATLHLSSFVSLRSFPTENINSL